MDIIAYFIFSEKVMKSGHLDHVNKRLVGLYDLARETDTAEFYDNILLSFINRMIGNDLYRPAYMIYGNDVSEVVLLDDDGNVCENYPFKDVEQTCSFLSSIVSALYIAQPGNDSGRSNYASNLQLYIDEIAKQDEALSREYAALKLSAEYYNKENERNDDDFRGGRSNLMMFGLQTSGYFESFKIERPSFLKDRKYELDSSWIKRFYRNDDGSNAVEYITYYNQLVWRKSNHHNKILMTDNASKLSIIVETVVNESLIQYVRMKKGIAMPKYFREVCDEKDMMQIPTGENHYIFLNKYKVNENRKRLETVSIGNAGFLLKRLRADDAFRNDELLSPFLDDSFIQLCIEFGKRRGYVIHSCEPIELSEFERILDLYRQFEKYGETFINLKNQVLAA